jgi:hypothetical protein
MGRKPGGVVETSKLYFVRNIESVGGLNFASLPTKDHLKFKDALNYRSTRLGNLRGTWSRTGESLSQVSECLPRIYEAKSARVPPLIARPLLRSDSDFDASRRFLTPLKTRKLDRG